MRPDLWKTTPQEPASITTVLIPGMISRQSADAVTTGLSSLPGVRRITVDLDNNRVTLQSTHPLEWTIIVAVVAEVGYDISHVSRAIWPDSPSNGSA